MKVTETSIPSVKLIAPRRFGDDRGFFMETWNARAFAQAGLSAEFVQDNHSCSSRGVLRGLHYQTRFTQEKLVRVTAGAIFDVAVDLRQSSETFGQHVGVELSSDNRLMLWVPGGFAHGFLTLSASAEVMYKCTDFYAPEWERTLSWDDPDLGICWPLEGLPPTLSAKDRAGVAFSKAELFP